MTKYGEVAVSAASILATDGSRTPPEAWQAAAERLLSYSPDMIKKGCPKDAFLGLCGEGLIQGAPRGPWTTSAANKAYALRAVLALQLDPTWIQRKSKLWRQVCGSETKRANSQLDVVFALWEAGLISRAS